MSIKKVRNIGVASVFRFFFGAFLVIGLVAMLLTDLGLVPARMPRLILYWRERFLALETTPQVVLGAFIVGVFAGLLATIGALLYNLFAALLGGIKIDIAEDDEEQLLG